MGLEPHRQREYRRPDGSQGYENESDARDMADRIIAGDFATADKRIRHLEP